MNRPDTAGILGGMPLEELEARCSELRKERFGDRVDLCAIINARNGGCSEDCSFCAQSRTAGSMTRSAGELVDAHRLATEAGIQRFSAVTSGRGPSPEELDLVKEMASRGRGLCPLCASLGIMGVDRLKELRDAGISRYHHNLEACEDFFPIICSTHSWQDRVATVRNAREAGLSVCSGGIMGIGENDSHRISLAFTLRELEVDSIALNFFVPVPGSRLRPGGLPGEKMLRIIGLFRLVNPNAEIRVCAGRESLEEHSSRVFDFGATGIMTGALLTTAGTELQGDLELIDRAGYIP
jgi:biotin synthase